MRAIAVLAVVLVHVANFGGAVSGSLLGRLFAHLNIGVTIFFLISGFLLYRPFIAHRTRDAPAPGIAIYGWRRFLRISPAYWVALTVLLLVAGLPGIGRTPLWPMYTLTQTIPIYGGPSCSVQIFTCGLAQTWSLGAELSFYIALPFYALALEGLARGLSLRAWMAAQLGALGALSAISILLQFVVLYPVPSWVGWTVTGTVFWFALGMGMAVASVALDALPAASASRRVARAVGDRGSLLWVLAVLIYLALSLWLPATSFIIAAGQLALTQLAFGVISLLLLAPVIFTGSRPRLPARITASRPMAWIGLISYGIFLWHYAVVLTLGPVQGTGSFLLLLVGTAAVSVACAAASYYALERPLMRLKYRRLRRPSRPSPAGAPG